MTRVEDLNSMILCPNDPTGKLECPSLAFNLSIATEAADSRIVMDALRPHESDESPHRIFALMKGIIKVRRQRPCEGCSSANTSNL